MLPVLPPRADFRQSRATLFPEIWNKEKSQRGRCTELQKFRVRELLLEDKGRVGDTKPVLIVEMKEQKDPGRRRICSRRRRRRRRMGSKGKYYVRKACNLRFANE